MAHLAWHIRIPGQAHAVQVMGDAPTATPDCLRPVTRAKNLTAVAVCWPVTRSAHSCCCCLRACVPVRTAASHADNPQPGNLAGVGAKHVPARPSLPVDERCHRGDAQQLGSWVWLGGRHSTGPALFKLYPRRRFVRSVVPARAEAGSAGISSAWASAQRAAHG